MRLLYLMTTLLFGWPSTGQVQITLQVPTQGLIQKQQLWNMVLVNNSSISKTVRLELNMIDLESRQSVMMATTANIMLLPGGNSISYTQLSPVQYVSTGVAYQINNEPYGILPPGLFEVCYSVTLLGHDGFEKLAEECDIIEIEPLSPPLLTYPYYESVVDTTRPNFSWMAPLPFSFFNDLKYRFDLTEVYANQSGAEAIEVNTPVFFKENVEANSLVYPPDAWLLQKDKKYAWRISAKNNNMVVARSEVWTFTVKEFTKFDDKSFFAKTNFKLIREEQPDYAICFRDLNIDYTNSCGDTTCTIEVFDITSGDKKDVQLNLSNIKCQRGNNQFVIGLDTNNAFLNKRLYMLELRNSCNELWRLKFEYRK
jgi:hypothetical protein